MDWYEIRTVSEAPGLEARIWADEWSDNPLTWIGAKLEHLPREGMYRVDGHASSEPTLITCPTCGGDGELEVHGFPVGCSRCEGDGEVEAGSSAEWCKDRGAVAAIPINYNLDGSQPWLRIEEWGEDGEPDAVVYLEDESLDEATLEGAIRDLETALVEGFHGVTIEVSEDSDLPEDVLEGFFEVSLGGMLGWKWVEEEAERILREAHDHVERELAERETWAKRGVVTVGGAV